MNNLILLLFLLCLVCLMIGIIKPNFVIRWGALEKRNRKNVFKYYGIGLIVTFVLFGITAPKSTTINETTTSSTKKESSNSQAEQNKALQEKSSSNEVKEIDKPVIKDTTKVLITAINHSKNSIGEDTVALTIKNNSDKVLKNFSVGIIGYDSNGFPIKLNFGSDDVFGGKGENVNIQPGESKNYNWTVYSPEHNLGKAKACIETYEFYDDSVQKNEYFNTWTSENSDKKYK